VIEPLRYAHEMSKAEPEEIGEMLERLAEVYPGLREDMERNMEQYGSPIVAGSLGARWPGDLPQDVYDLLNEYRQPLEMVIHPQDGEAHHWAIDWYILTWDDQQGCYRRAIDVDKRGEVKNV